MQVSFEREFRNYLRLQECEGVPSLVAVVRRDGMIRGFLISYIDGKNLGEARIASETELLAVTSGIISRAAGLETVGYYNEDLKCENILRRQSDGAIYFVDFAGGLTEGFYPEESFRDLCRGKIDPNVGVYILGKTLWQLWTRDIPSNEVPDSIPDPVRNIIHDCCIARKFDNIKELQKAWSLVIYNATVGGFSNY